MSDLSRRSFLAALGAGALSLAGKKPPPRPSFTIELEVSASAIWVNGKQPEKAWQHDEGFYQLDIDFKNLEVGGVQFYTIKSCQNSCDDSYLKEGSDVTMTCSKGVFHGKLMKIVEPVNKVTLKNGKVLDLGEEGQRYYVLEF